MSDNFHHLKGELELDIKEGRNNDIIVSIKGGTKDGELYPKDDITIFFCRSSEREESMEEQLHDFFTKGKEVIEKRIVKKDL